MVEKSGRKGFEITYVYRLCDLLECIGDKIVKYILENKSVDNLVIATLSEIASKTGLSMNTVFIRMKMLEEAGIIKRKQGIIMLDPRIAHKGKEVRENKLKKMYEEFGKKPKYPERLAKLDKQKKTLALESQK